MKEIIMHNYVRNNCYIIKNRTNIKIIKLEIITFTRYEINFEAIKSNPNIIPM